MAENDPFPPYQVLIPQAHACDSRGSLDGLASTIHAIRGRRGMTIEDYQLAWENPQGMRSAIWIIIADPAGPLRLLVCAAGEDAAALSEALKATRPRRARAA